MCFDYHIILLLLLLSCRLCNAFLISCYCDCFIVSFFSWICCTWTEGVSKQPLYLHNVVVGSAYTLPSPDPTCGILLGMLSCMASMLEFTQLLPNIPSHFSVKTGSSEIANFTISRYSILVLTIVLHFYNFYFNSYFLSLKRFCIKSPATTRWCGEFTRVSSITYCVMSSKNLLWPTYHLQFAMLHQKKLTVGINICIL